MNPHLARDPVRAGVGLSEARMVGVFVHGREQDEEVMLDVAQRLELPDVGYVLPAAEGGSWYDGRYFDPLADNQPAVQWALESIEAAIGVAQAAGVGPERIVLAGFSQGACLVAELVARRPQPFAGVAVLTGTLLGPDRTEVAPARVDGLPMFICCSRYDEWIALERAQSTARAFAAAGAAVTFETYDDRVHHVSDRAVAGLRRLFVSERASA